VRPIAEWIILGSDHAGYTLKEQAKKHLHKRKRKVVDCTPVLVKGDNYPLIAYDVGEMVTNTKKTGILICGSGIGMSIAANKIPGIRAAVGREVGDAIMARNHNDANILCLGAHVTSREHMEEIIDAFLATPFAGTLPSGERHKKRVDMLV
jgi:ribose 5-phosphate isomerase B